jgi:hypothetical protein
MGLRLSFLTLTSLFVSPLMAQTDAQLAHAKKLLEQTILIDGHNDLPWEIRTAEGAPRDVAAYDLRTPRKGMTDLARLAEGRVGAQFWSIYIPGEIKDSGFARVQLEQFDIARRMIARYPDRLMLALTADDIVKAKKQKKIASLLGMEGGHAIENSLGALRSYYDLGARYMTLTHNVTLDWADAALDSVRHDGLTRFGEEVGPRDEPTGHAGGPVSRLTRCDERCAQRYGSSGDLLPLLLPRAGGLPSQRSGFDSREIAPELVGS